MGRDAFGANAARLRGFEGIPFGDSRGAQGRDTFRANAARLRGLGRPGGLPYRG